MEVITAFGDSILKGIINSEDRYTISKKSFSCICEDKLNIKIVNKAMMGSTIIKGLQIFERSRNTVAESTGKYVLLKFGGNDCDYDWNAVSEDPDADISPRTSPKEFRKGYISLIEKVRETGKEPILLSLPPIDPHNYFSWISREKNADNILKFLGGREEYLKDWHEMYNLEVFKIAAFCESEIIDISSCFLKRNNYSELLCTDGIHPNEKGHEIIAQEICKWFLEKQKSAY